MAKLESQIREKVRNELRQTGAAKTRRKAKVCPEFHVPGVLQKMKAGAAGSDNGPCVKVAKEAYLRH